jgi:hypothetical protein
MLEDVFIMVERPMERDSIRDIVHSIYEDSVVNPTLTLWGEALDNDTLTSTLGELSKLISRYSYCACWLNIKVNEGLDLMGIKDYKSGRMPISLIVEKAPRQDDFDIPFALYFPLSKENLQEVLKVVDSGENDVLLEVSDSLPFNDFMSFIKEVILLPLEQRKRIYFTNHALSSTLHLKPNMCGAGETRLLIDSSGKRYPCYDAYKFVKKYGEYEMRSLDKCKECSYVSCNCKALFPYSDEERCKIIKTMLINASEILSFYL